MPPEDLARARRELTVAPIDRSGVGFPKRFKVYWELGGVVYAPRFWSARPPAPPPAAPIRAAFAGQLLAEMDQPRAVAQTLGSMRACGGAVLSAYTGQGKTAMACKIVAELGVKTLVLVHKDVLRTQWAERVAQFLPGTSVSFVQGPVCDTSGDVVVAMVQTLVARRLPPCGLGLVVADECHHIGAEVFSTAMRGLAVKYTLGLSATPERKDGLSRVMHWFLGPLAYASVRADMVGVHVRVVRYDCDAYRSLPPTNRMGTVCFASVMTALVEDEARTAAVAAVVRGLLEEAPGRRVLVLSHRRAHCQELAERTGGVAFLGGGAKAKNKDAQAQARAARCVCATFALVSEGYDDPTLGCLVLATPCSDVVQAAGRVMRGTAGDALIVDVVDQWGTCFAQAAKRRAYYRQAGFTVT